MNYNRLKENFYIMVQARLSSSRLPKKVLCDIEGLPLLGYLVGRLKKTKSKIIICTSNDPSDDLIEKFCRKNNILCFRGELNNVANRLLHAAKEYEAESFVRINGDSPLIESELISRAVDLFQNSSYDIVTNTFPRSYPVGQSVEVIKTDALKKAYRKMSDLSEFEHVTKYFYTYSENFKIYNFKNETDLSNFRMVVDTPEDLARFRKLIRNMDKPYTEYSFKDIIPLYSTC